MFERVIDGIIEDNFNIVSASVTPVTLKGFVRYVGVYEINVEAKKPAVVVRAKVTTYTKPTKEAVKKTPKKVFKKQARDSKGRFKKGK